MAFLLRITLNPPLLIHSYKNTVLSLMAAILKLARFPCGDKILDSGKRIYVTFEG